MPICRVSEEHLSGRRVRSRYRQALDERLRSRGGDVCTLSHGRVKAVRNPVRDNLGAYRTGIRLTGQSILGAGSYSDSDFGHAAVGDPILPVARCLLRSLRRPSTTSGVYRADGAPKRPPFLAVHCLKCFAESREHAPTPWVRLSSGRFLEGHYCIGFYK